MYLTKSFWANRRNFSDSGLSSSLFMALKYDKGFLTPFMQLVQAIHKGFEFLSEGIP